MEMTDRKIELLVGNLLRVGVLAAAFVVGLGGAAYLAQHHSERVSYKVFQSESAEMRSVPGIWHSALHFHSEGLIQLGLLILIATPVARVALAAIGFYLERDRLYVGVSLFVLAVLVYSMMHAS